MKCNPQRTLDNEYLKKIRQEEEREQEYIDSLSDEQRAEYLQQKKERQKKSVKMFSQLLGMVSAFGIDKKY